MTYGSHKTHFIASATASLERKPACGARPRWLYPLKITAHVDKVTCQRCVVFMRKRGVV